MGGRQRVEGGVRHRLGRQRRQGRLPRTRLRGRKGALLYRPRAFIIRRGLGETSLEQRSNSRVLHES